MGKVVDESHGIKLLLKTIINEYQKILFALNSVNFDDLQHDSPVEAFYLQ